MKKLQKEDIPALLIPAGLFAVMGVGFIINQLLVGIFVGLGLGFLAMTIVKLSKKK